MDMGIFLRQFCCCRCRLASVILPICLSNTRVTGIQTIRNVPISSLKYTIHKCNRKKKNSLFFPSQFRFDWTNTFLTKSRRSSILWLSSISIKKKFMLGTISYRGNKAMSVCPSIQYIIPRDTEKKWMLYWKFSHRNRAYSIYDMVLMCAYNLYILYKFSRLVSHTLIRFLSNIIHFLEREFPFFFVSGRFYAFLFSSFLIWVIQMVKNSKLISWFVADVWSIFVETSDAEAKRGRNTEKYANYILHLALAVNCDPKNWLWRSYLKHS